MTNDSSKEQAISYLRADLDALDRQIAELQEERAGVARTLARLTGEAPPSTIERVVPLPAPVSLKETQAAPPPSPNQAGEGERAYHSRAFNKRVVEEAIATIRAQGKPLSAPEINLTHSARHQIPSEMLYRLLYNRVVSGSLMTIDGAFWPENEELPPGYSLDRAKRSTKLGD